MGIKLGDISPLAGLVTGEGLTTNFGLVPALLAKNRRDKEEEEKKKAAMAEEENRMRQSIAAGMNPMAGVNPTIGMKKGGKVSSTSKSSKVSSASKRADGIAQRGKTKGRMV